MLFTELLAEPKIRQFSFRDDSFVTGDSPVTHDVFAIIKRNSVQGSVYNDGAGAIIVNLSHNATPTWGQDIYVDAYEELVLDRESINQLKVTWVADTSYRIMLS